MSQIYQALQVSSMYSLHRDLHNYPLKFSNNIGEGTDYIVASVRVTAFSDATQLPDNVTVTFCVDAIAQEPDETFTLTLNPIAPLTPREGLFFRNTTQVTIVDEESKNALILCIKWKV